MASIEIHATDLATRLAERTLELIDIGSESGRERDVGAHLLSVSRDGRVPARDAGDSCVIAGASSRRERPFVLLAGHLDTVPEQSNRPGRFDGEHVVGLGASDMKGGVAVMLELALSQASGAFDVTFDVGYLFFGREELPSSESALAPLLAREAGLREADLAIVLEPTSNVVQAGCLGNLDAAWTFAGRAGHSARPWLAENAIDHAVEGIRALHAIEPLRSTADRLEFTQVVSATTLHAGIAPNVIPGSAVANVNFRYAPGTSAKRAERQLREWCEPYGELEIVSNSPGALPPHANPMLDRLLEITGAAAEPKQAWTPVAEFAAVGVEAVNLGPGDPAFAHRADERVATAALTRSYEILRSFLCA